MKTTLEQLRDYHELQENVLFSKVIDNHARGFFLEFIDEVEPEDDFTIEQDLLEMWRDEQSEQYISADFSEKLTLGNSDMFIRIDFDADATIHCDAAICWTENFNATVNKVVVNMWGSEFDITDLDDVKKYAEKKVKEYYR